jgi:hypothetical protein
MKYNFDFNQATIYDTMDKFIKDNEQVMIKARKNCAKNGLTKEQVSAIFGYCYHNLKDNKKKLTSYRDYCEKEANKTKTKNNKKKSLTKTLQDIQRFETVKYYIKNKLGKTMSILENPYTTENMF